MRRVTFLSISFNLGTVHCVQNLFYWLVKRLQNYSDDDDDYDDDDDEDDD